MCRPEKKGLCSWGELGAWELLGAGSAALFSGGALGRALRGGAPGATDAAPGPQLLRGPIWGTVSAPPPHRSWTPRMTWCSSACSWRATSLAVQPLDRDIFEFAVFAASVIMQESAQHIAGSRLPALMQDGFNHNATCPLALAVRRAARALGAKLLSQTSALQDQPSHRKPVPSGQRSR